MRREFKISIGRQFWKGKEIRDEGKYAHIRRKMQRRKLMKDVKKLKDKERKIVEQ